MHAMFQISPADGRSGFRAEGKLFTAFIVKGVHLFFHNISTHTDATAEKSGVLKDREINPLVSVELADAGDFLLNVTPVVLFFRLNVYRAARCFKQFNTSMLG